MGSRVMEWLVVALGGVAGGVAVSKFQWLLALWCGVAVMMTAVAMLRREALSRARRNYPPE